MHISQLVSEYGYLAILIVTFLEGETIQIVAGWMAHTGQLSYPYVVLAGFAGSLAGDQLYYWLGRRFGRPLMHRFPRLERKSEPALALLRRHDNWFILGFRFVYGVRNVAPFACGVAGIGALRYTLLNTTAAFIWATSFATAGYYFGKAVGHMLNHYGMTVVLPVVVVVVLLWLFAHRIRGWIVQRRRALSEAAAAAVAPSVVPGKAD